MNPILLVNFGGPRDLSEIESFLGELLTDQDVIRTHLPQWIHNYIFRKVAKKRTEKIKEDYKLIGNKSPIFEDTENLAFALENLLQTAVIPFHRYLPSTHYDFLEKVKALPPGPITVLPLFPQFSYATTGSIARFFAKNLCGKILHRLRWIKSYAKHESYIEHFTKHIKAFLQTHNIEEDKTLLLFSAHGVPQNFICTGDLYQEECEASFALIQKHFASDSLLCYQSKFGPGAWLKPYTSDISSSIEQYTDKNQVVFIPLSFTSDHIETLYEVEYQYLNPIKASGKNAWRCPAFHIEPSWLQTLKTITTTSDLVNNQMLIRNNFKRCCTTCCPKNLCLCAKLKSE